MNFLVDSAGSVSSPLYALPRAISPSASATRADFSRAQSRSRNRHTAQSTTGGISQDDGRSVWYFVWF